MSLKINIAITFSVITFLIIVYSLVTQIKENRAKDDRLRYLTKELAKRDRIIDLFDESDKESDDDESGENSDSDVEDPDAIANTSCVVSANETSSEPKIIEVE